MVWIHIPSVAPSPLSTLCPYNSFTKPKKAVYCAIREIKSSKAIRYSSLSCSYSAWSGCRSNANSTIGALDSTSESEHYTLSSNSMLSMLSTVAVSLGTGPYITGILTLFCLVRIRLGPYSPLSMIT